MIVIKDNNRFYFVESVYTYVEYGCWDRALVLENMPIFKAHGSNVLIGGCCNAELDLLRYSHLPFPAQLSAEKMIKDIAPRVKGIIRYLGRTDEDDEISVCAFAKGDRAFILQSELAVREVFNEEVFGWNESRTRYALATTAGLPLIERLRETYRTVGKILGCNLFPLVMMDSVSFKLRIIGEEDK